MPPKKSDPKKKDDKNKGEEEPNEEERELIEKELVIGYLKSKLGRYQDTGDKLQVENVKLNEELETSKNNLKDINEFLTNELKARSLTTTALEGRLLELQRLLEDHKKQQENQLQELASLKDKEIEALGVKIKEYEKKMRTTQEFLERKDFLENELAELKDTLDKKVREYEQRLVDMDRQHIQDREKWKRDMAQRIKETKLQMMKLTDNQLEMTTKRTIMENEQMSIELAYQSRQTEKLLGKNGKLLEENADLRRQLELSKQTEEELAKRNHVYQKTIKTLLTKLKESNITTNDNGVVVMDLEQQISDLEQALKLASLQFDEKSAEANALREALTEQRAASGQASEAIEETVRFLLKCMEDVRAKIVTVVTEQHPHTPEPDIQLIPGRLEELSSEQRERVLAYLVDKLRAWQQREKDGMAVPVPPAANPALFPPPPSTLRGGSGGPSAPGSPANGGGEGGVVLPPIIARSNLGKSSSPPGTGRSIAVASEPSWPAPTSPNSGPGPGTAGSNDLRSSQNVTPQTAQGVPPVDELLMAVMSDVRPWGQRSTQLPLTTKSSHTFLKKSSPSPLSKNPLPVSYTH